MTLEVVLVSLEGIVVSNLLRRNPSKIFLQGVSVTLPGVLVSYEESFRDVPRFVRIVVTKWVLNSQNL